MRKYFILNKRTLMRKWYKHASQNTSNARVTSYRQAQNCFVHIQREVDSILQTFYDKE